MKCDKCGFDKDRIKFLKTQLAELNKKVEEADIEYHTTKKLMEMVKEKMDLSSDKNTEVYRHLMKEQLAKQMDALRLRTDMIQKISPESAELLKKILNDYEQAHHDFFGAIEAKDEEYSAWRVVAGFFTFMTEIAGMGQKIDDIVKVCSFSIRDTLKRLES